MSDATIKLFISAHKDGIAFPDCPLVEPIQVGAALNGRIPGMLHDDEGDNISKLNERYCELTAQYWAWKHEDADYYGFMHYRRYFSFNPSLKLETNFFSEAELSSNDPATLAKLGYDERRMRAIIERYDFIAPEAGSFVDKGSIRYNYEIAWQQRPEDLECVLDIIAERYPDYLDIANRYLDGTEGYFCNMFIMRKELFQDYSAWLFDILAEFDKRRDVSDYDVTSYRVDGYLGERLCGIYLAYLKEKGLKWTTLQRVLFDKVDAPRHLEPAFPSAPAEGPEPVTIVFSANDYYAPYLGALIKSVVDTSSPSRLYDIIVLNEDFSERNELLLKQLAERDNVSLRFLDVSAAMRQYQDKLYLRGHFKVETYFRLLLPQLLPGYHKVLYLDADMIVLHDVADLYDVDVTGKLVAAVRDVDTAGLYNGAPHSGTKMAKKAYMDDVLRMKHPFDYFQAGTIVFNLDEWRKAYTPDQIFSYASSYEWQLLDQDVLNHLCEGRVAYVDMAWNVMVDWRGIRVSEIAKRAPRQMYFSYLEARKKPYVIHYAGPDKPWTDPSSDMAEAFWAFSRKTPFYETAMLRMCQQQDSDDRSEVQKAKEFAYRKVAVPIVHKVFPENSRGLETARYLYRKVHPQH